MKCLEAILTERRDDIYGFIIYVLRYFFDAVECGHLEKKN